MTSDARGASRASPPRGRLHALATERNAVPVLIGLIALHVLDDNFLQPQPGVSAGDHLVSGLVPLAALIAVAVMYPRLRAGLRASLALVLGVSGIVWGATEAAYYGPKDGLSGDDYTGLVSAAAGAVLVGIGVVTLWRSRRRGGAPLRRYGRRLLLAIAAVLVVLFVLFPFSLSYGFTHVARPKTASGDLGAPYQPVTFKTSDGLEMKGWFVPSKNGATVIVYPGKKGTQKHARLLVRHGYGVLVFDRRGEGESDGDPTALGWTFNRDLKGAIAFLRERAGVDRNRIGGLGLSVGGEAFLQAAAETKAIKAVVSEGAGARSVREDVVHMRAGKIPEIVASGVITGGTALFSNTTPPPSLKDLVSKISPTPVFFIYATKGAGGEENNPDYYAAAGQPKQIWKIETSHTHGLDARPREYERRVIGFFDRALRVR